MKKRFTSLFGAIDMTQGNPSRNLIVFSIPLLIGNMAQLLYTTVDSIVVGRVVGDKALAAVGASNPILFLLIVMFIGVAMGSSIMVSQYFGAKDRAGLSGTVGTSLTLTGVFTVLMMVAGPLLSPIILRALNTPPDIIGMAEEYLIISFIGIIGPGMYNILSGILRGLGDSLMPLLFLIIASGINIGLDIWFVAGLGWGVGGVAWATVIAQLVSALLCLARILQMKEVLEVKPAHLKPERKLVRQLLRLGIPSGATQAIFSMAMLVVQNLTNHYGTIMVATANVVMRVDSFAMMPNFTFGTAMTTFTGQNIGAGRMDRVVEGTRKGIRLGVIVSSCLVLLLLIFGKTMMSFFTDTTEVIELGTRMIRFLSVGYIGVAITQILCGVMRGAGDTMVPMIISLVSTVAFRVPIAYGIEFLTRPQGGKMGSGSPDAIFISLLVSWVLGGVLSAIFYVRGKWKTKGLSRPKQDASEENETLQPEAEAEA